MCSRRDPVVTVGLPVYNGALTIRRAIESVLAQSFKNFELLISDNCSSDDTVAIIAEYARSDSRVRYVQQRRNIGAAGNYNALVHLANGRFFRWISHDDTMADDFLSVTVPVMIRDEEIITVATDMEIKDETGCTQQVVRTYVDRSAWGTSRVVQYRQMMEELAYCETHNDGLLMVAYEYGLHRTDLLKMTRLVGRYVSSDYVLAAELSLWGRLVHVNEPCNRFFLSSSKSGTTANYVNWDPVRIQAMLSGDIPSYASHSSISTRRRHWEHVAAVLRSPLPYRDKAAALPYAMLPTLARARARFS